MPRRRPKPEPEVESARRAAAARANAHALAVQSIRDSISYWHCCAPRNGHATEIAACEGLLKQLQSLEQNRLR